LWLAFSREEVRLSIRYGTLNLFKPELRVLSLHLSFDKRLYSVLEEIECLTDALMICDCHLSFPSEQTTGAATLYIEPGSPWENGYCESFNSKLHDDFLNGEIFYSFKEMQILAERWRICYNPERPHSSLGHRPPAPRAWKPEASLGHGKVESQQGLPPFPRPRLRRRVN